MWDSVSDLLAVGPTRVQLSHDMPCPRCGHAMHTYLACGDYCDCPPVVMPGIDAA